MSKPEDIPQDVWDAAVKCIGVGGGYGMQGVIQTQRENIARAIIAAKADERERIRSAVVGHIMTVVESLMEGRMTDSGLSKKDHIEMQAQIEALDVVAEEIQALTFGVSTAHKNKIAGE